MLLVWRLAVWSAVVALGCCGFNTPEEILKAREAFEKRRRRGKHAQFPANRIFGGFRTHVGQYPFAVYILIKDNQGHDECTGSLVAPDWVLTALHCKGKGGWEAIVFAGDVDYSTDRVFTKINIQIRVAVTATSYNPTVPDRLDHDVMLLRMHRAFTLEAGFVDVIPITEQKEYPETFYERCTVVGFGLRGKDLSPEAGIQRGASFIMEPGPNCRFPGVDINGLCSFDIDKKSVCVGDSGGPIFCSGVQVQMGTVVGAKYKNCSAMWCGAPVWKNIHMFAGFYRDWIMAAINPQQARGGHHNNTSASPRLEPALLLLLCGHGARLCRC